MSSRKRQLDLLASKSRPVISITQSVPVDMKPGSEPERRASASSLAVARAPLGRCACGQAFRIPGLDNSLCPACGWVKTPRD